MSENSHIAVSVLPKTHDTITVLSEVLKIAKAINSNVLVTFPEYKMWVRPTSEILDLIEISKLKNK